MNGKQNVGYHACAMSTEPPPPLPGQFQEFETTFLKLAAI